MSHPESTADYENKRGKIFRRSQYQRFTFGIVQVIYFLYGFYKHVIQMKNNMILFNSYSTTFLYNYCNSYSLMSYMEYPIILLQEIVLIYYVLKYSKLLEQFNVQMYALLYFAIVSVFLLDLISPAVLTFVLVILHIIF